MLPGKSCTRFWVPGGSQGSQEGVPGLPGGNTPAVRPFGLQGEEPSGGRSPYGPNTGLCSNHHPRFCACSPGNLAQHVVVILRSQVFSACGGMRVWRHSPRETLFGVSGRGHPAYSAIVHYLYFSALVDECVSRSCHECCVVYVLKKDIILCITSSAP